MSILANSFGHPGGGTVTSTTVGGEKVHILPLNGSTMYLGRLLSLSDFHGTELNHRISRAWKKFNIYSKTLCDRNYSLNHRLKLFAATVTPTVLYGCVTWTLTVDNENQLRRVQRRMLRKMVGSKRRMAEFDGACTSDSGSDTLSQQQSDSSQRTILEDWVTWAKNDAHSRRSMQEIGAQGLGS